ncbi:MAG: hypothetical protein J1E43_04840 [Christensenellaceae bacterium]|nr:hypothetical protein [Christensenellaceae bacterium]
MTVYLAIDAFGLTEAQPYKTLVDIALGLIIGALITGVIYTSRHLSKIRAAKTRLWKRISRGGQGA